VRFPALPGGEDQILNTHDLADRRHPFLVVGGDDPGQPVAPSMAER
jgi:hypothetical protein